MAESRLTYSGINNSIESSLATWYMIPCLGAKIEDGKQISYYASKITFFLATLYEYTLKYIFEAARRPPIYTLMGVDGQVGTFRKNLEYNDLPRRWFPRYWLNFLNPNTTGCLLQ